MMRETTPKEKQAIAFMTEHDCCLMLFDDQNEMRRSVLAALEQLLYDRFEPLKVILLTSKYAAVNLWTPEIVKSEFASNLTCKLLVGNAHRKLAAVRRKADITVANYESLEWLLTNKLWEYNCVVVDEISAFKNPKTKRFQSLSGVAAGVKRKIFLTGEPVNNRFEDIWAEMFLLDGGIRLGRSKSLFLERYYYYDHSRGKRLHILKNGAKQAVCERIRDVCYGFCEKKDQKDKLFGMTYAVLSPSELSKYQWLERQLSMPCEFRTETAWMNGEGMSGKIRLMQAANGAIYQEEREILVLHEKKLDALREIFSRKAERPILIAYWFLHDLEQILKRFPQVFPIQTEHDAVRWRKGDYRIGAVNASSGNLESYLDRADQELVWYSLTWSLHHYRKTIQRAFADRHPVRIEHIVAKHTIDERIMETLREKESVQNEVVWACTDATEGIRDRGGEGGSWKD